MAGTMSEYDEATPLRSTFCSKLTVEQYDQETSDYTQQSLSGLIEFLDEYPNEYSKVIKRRRREEAESSSVLSYLKVQTNNYAILEIATPT